MIVAASWGALLIALAAVQNPPYDGDYIKMYLYFLLAWVIPSFLLLACGAAVRLVIRGRTE